MASGIPTQEAKAHAKALGEAMSNELAKRSDLNEFRTEVRGELKTLRAEVNGKFNEVKGQYELLKWMMGFVLAGMAAMLLKIF
jgi:hypothetical protein